MVHIRIVQLQLPSMSRVLFIILISLASLTIVSCSNDDDSSGITTSNDNSSFTLKISTFEVNTADTSNTVTGPILTSSTEIFTPNIDNTPNYTFSSSEAGTISYDGSCSSSTTLAIVGNNTITFNALANGTYDSCSITVTNIDGESSTLNLSTFVIDTTLEGATITGSVLSQSSNSALSNVSVNLVKSGSIIIDTVTDSTGNFSQALTLGTYT